MIYLNLNANILLNTSIVLIIGDIFFIFVLRYDLSTIKNNGHIARYFLCVRGTGEPFARGEAE